MGAVVEPYYPPPKRYKPRGDYEYMLVTADALELPLYCTSDVHSMAAYARVSVNHVYHAAKRGGPVRRCGAKIVRVKIDEDEDD